MLHDPKQQQYLVQGYTLPRPSADDVVDKTTSKAPVPTQVSDKSLQIKPQNKSVMTRQQQTMTTTDESSSIPVAAAQSNEDVNDGLCIAETGSDELDAAIRDAKKFEHLVRVCCPCIRSLH